MKKLIFAILICFTIIPNNRGLSQAQDTLNCKFLLSFLYIKTDKEINQKIKNIFNYKKYKKYQCVEINISNYIEFLPITYFSNNISHTDIGLDSIIFRDEKKYYEMFKFSPYKEENLSKIVNINKSSLYITFTEPINNYIIAEIIDRDIGQGIKMGKAIQILFIFDDLGKIKRVFYSTCHYN